MAAKLSTVCADSPKFLCKQVNRGEFQLKSLGQAQQGRCSGDLQSEGHRGGRFASGGVLAPGDARGCPAGHCGQLDNGPSGPASLGGSRLA
jgi:hypothetical protein